MKNLSWVAALALLPMIGFAQDFDNGLAAYQSGDYATALQEWRPLAEQGDVSAQYNLGLMFRYGRGVPPDYVEAVRWFKLAAEQGLADAQHNLGLGYGTGYGVPQDYAEALRWYKMAAVQGNANAQVKLGVMYSDGIGVLQDYAEAERWYKLAAEQGITMAQVSLGLMYIAGRQGVPQNYLAAHMWANIAFANGSEGASVVRKIAAKKMTQADITEAQRRATVCMASNYQDCD